MNTTGNELKKAKNLKEWIQHLYVTNLITVIVETLIFASIYFIVLGPDESVIDVIIPGFTSMGFMILFVPFGIVTVPIGIINGSRRDCIQGKWKIEEREMSEPAKNPWNRVGREAIILGATTTIFLWLLFWFVIPELLDPIISISFSMGAVVIFTTFLLRKHLTQELGSFWSAYVKKEDNKNQNQKQKQNQKPLRKYFVRTYVVPWSLILLYLLFNLGLKSNHDSFLAGGSVDFLTLYKDTLSTGVLSTIWMWYVAKTKFEVDVNIGRVSTEGKKLSKNWLIVLLVIVPIATASIVYLLNQAHLLVMDTYSVSAIEATLLDIFVGVSLGVFGLYLGILWGRMKFCF